MDPQLLTVLLALIAPASAIVAGLGGVVLGQRMARTTAAQQIEAQDRRDELARAREDQFRHVEPKRDLYAELLAVAVRFGLSMEAMREVVSAPVGPSSIAEIQAVLIGRGTELPSDVVRDWSLAASKVSLVAPANVRSRAFMLGTTMQVNALLLDLDEHPPEQERIAQHEKTTEKLRDQMRADLGAEPGADAVPAGPGVGDASP